MTRTVIPADTEWRFRNMDRACRWLRDNGIEPATVPLEGSIVIHGRRISYESFEFDARGEMKVRVDADGTPVEALRAIRTRKLRRAWSSPAALRAGLIKGRRRR